VAAAGSWADGEGGGTSGRGGSEGKKSMRGGGRNRAGMKTKAEVGLAHQSTDAYEGCATPASRPTRVVSRTPQKKVFSFFFLF
jgi:hypothetical protein